MKKLLIYLSLFVSLFMTSAMAADKGKEAIGKLSVSLYLGADDADVNAGPKAKQVQKTSLKSISKLKGLQFKHYFLLGNDQPDVLRSYKNWAAPLKHSEAILLSFEPVGKPFDKKIKLDLNLWQSKKKIMKSAATLQIGKPLYIRGPQWRGGYLIIMIELKSLK